MLDGSPLAVRDIEVGSPADDTLQALQALPSTRGQGERESIALAAHDAGLVFVANDRGAMWLALRELHAPGERLLGVPVFLRRLHGASATEPATVDAVMRHWSGQLPTWWADWRASIEPPAAQT